MEESCGNRGIEIFASPAHPLNVSNTNIVPGRAFVSRAVQFVRRARSFSAGKARLVACTAQAPVKKAETNVIQNANQEKSRNQTEISMNLSNTTITAKCAGVGKVQNNDTPVTTTTTTRVIQKTRNVPGRRLSKARAMADNPAKTANSTNSVAAPSICSTQSPSSV